MNINETYNNNADFKLYVDKYSKQRGISVKEALQHELVRQVYLYYTEDEESSFE